jgi:hypothetical protein
VLGGYQKQEYRPPAVIGPVLGGFITTVLNRNKDWVLVYNPGANLFLKIKSNNCQFLIGSFMKTVCSLRF